MRRKLDYKKAIQLRMLGKSYNEIAKDLDVGKSLLSYWLKDLQLPKEAKKILEAKSNYPREKFAEYNRLKHERVQRENQEIKEKSISRINKINNRELLLLGSALYWGEGYKRHGGKYPSPHISFSNSDPDMIKVFLVFLKEILRTPEDKIRVWIHLHPNLNRKASIRFWSKITDISQDRFSVTTQVSVASRGKRPKNSLPYGTLNLRIHSRQKFFEVMGFIGGIIKSTI